MFSVSRRSGLQAMPALIASGKSRSDAAGRVFFGLFWAIAERRGLAPDQLGARLPVLTDHSQIRLNGHRVARKLSRFLFAAANP